MKKNTRNYNLNTGYQKIVEIQLVDTIVEIVVEIVEIQLVDTNTGTRKTLETRITFMYFLKQKHTN